jgi:hypothetical protein
MTIAACAAALVGTMALAAEADARERTRSGSFTGPRGTTSWARTTTCGGGTCSRLTTVEGPRGGTIERQGAITGEDGGGYSRRTTVTGPEGNSWSRARQGGTPIE